MGSSFYVGSGGVSGSCAGQNLLESNILYVFFVFFVTSIGLGRRRTLVFHSSGARGRKSEERENAGKNAGGSRARARGARAGF